MGRSLNFMATLQSPETEIFSQPLKRRWQSAKEWCQQQLFNTWSNTILTLLCILVLGSLGLRFGQWALQQAQWSVVTENIRFLMIGRYTPSDLWRPWLTALLWASILSLTWGAAQGTTKKDLLRYGLIGLAVAIAAGVLRQELSSVLWITGITVSGAAALWLGDWLTRYSLWRKLILPLWVVGWFVAAWLIGGGFGLATVPIRLWNGLLLTLWIATFSIALSFPLGVLLALGRRSSLPVIKVFSILYIEIVRGLPLIGILFITQVMLKLLVPPYINLDQLTRAIAGFTLFSAAYLAETVRGGLQSIPKGQTEAARALGLSTPLTLGLVVLPQALKAVVPAIVGQFISLFKDTALLSVFGLVELTGMGRSITSQPENLGRYAEIYLVIGLIYWVFCYGMSLASRRLEHQK
jgi:general L-amino acid transport system permease protein